VAAIHADVRKRGEIPHVVADASLALIEKSITVMVARPDGPFAEQALKPWRRLERSDRLADRGLDLGFVGFHARRPHALTAGSKARRPSRKSASLSASPWVKHGSCDLLEDL